MEQRGPGHTVGSRKIFEKGFLDYKKDIEDAIAALDYLNDMDAYSRRNQLRAMAIDCDAIILLANRYADPAEKMTAEKTRPSAKRSCCK